MTVKEATKKLQYELIAKLKTMQTSPHQVRLAKFVDTLDELLKKDCKIGDFYFAPVIENNKLILTSFASNLFI